MPKLGLTMQEGTVSAWNVAAGDEVRAGDVIFVVETDKIATEVEARGDGRIEEIRVPEGDTVPVGAVVATWTGPALGADAAEEDASMPEGPASETPLSAEPTPPPQATAIPSPTRAAGDRVLATPYARRLAKEAGLDLAAIAGSGPRGRIKAQDIEGARNAPALAPAPATSSAPAAAFTAMADADLTALLALRDQLAEEAGTAFDLLPFLALATAKSLRAIGLDTPFAQAADLSLEAMARKLTDEAPDPVIALDVQPASDPVWLTPQLTPGFAAALGLGPIRAQFLPDADGAPVLRHIAPLSLAGDPAALEAARAKELLHQIVERLQCPLRTLL